MKVIHSYEKKNLRKLRRNEEADCSKCDFAEKTLDIEGGYVYLCHAALYDIETLSCFVPKASPDCLEAVRWSAKALKALRPVSREQVEKVFPGCEECHNQDNWPSWIEKGFVYCPKCGTPLASWAWEKQIERLEALEDG